MFSPSDRYALFDPRPSRLLAGPPGGHRQVYASGVSDAEARPGVWRWILVALHDSRSREAARVIRRHGHLLSAVAVKPAATEAGSPEPAMISRIAITAVLALFALAHGLGLQKMHANDKIDPASPRTAALQGD
jgi:hypothetical protein